MVQIFLDFAKSIRLRDWDPHIQSTERMLPWIHVYDQINYVRYISYYWYSHQKIQNKFTIVYQQFQHRNHFLRRTKAKFNMFSPDQPIEQTKNKDQKGTGTIDILTSQGSMQRWILSSHNGPTLIADLRKSLDLNTGDSTTKNISLKWIPFDENAVKKCYTLIKNWTNPFTESSNILCFSSRLVL